MTGAGAVGLRPNPPGTVFLYNGPPVKTKYEKVIVNQEFPNSYDLYCPLSRKVSGNRVR